MTVCGCHVVGVSGYGWWMGCGWVLLWAVHVCSEVASATPLSIISVSMLIIFSSSANPASPQLLALSSSTRLYTVGLKTGPNLGYVNEIKIAKKEEERGEGGGEGRKSKKKSLKSMRRIEGASAGTFLCTKHPYVHPYVSEKTGWALRQAEALGLINSLAPFCGTH